MILFKQIVTVLMVCAVCAGCKPEITLKESGLTAINPLSYTEVIYKSNQDTVLTASFDGKIREVIKGEPERKLIIDVADEVYSLAYNAGEKRIYAATLNSGILVIDEANSVIEKTLPIKEKWTRDISYDPQSKVLMAADFSGNAYLWQTDEDYELISIPEEFSKMTPKTISQNVIYFAGKGFIGKWDRSNDQIQIDQNVKGEVIETDREGNVLTFSHHEFRVYNTYTDSLKFKSKHPNWPIYVPSMDTLVRAPVSLYLTAGILTENKFYTSSTDRSIRVWNKKSGEFVEDLLGHRATISAMDLSKSETQLVSVDLKGGIHFWDLKE